MKIALSWCGPQIGKEAVLSNVVKSMAKVLGGVEQGLPEACELNGFLSAALLFSRLLLQAELQLLQLLAGGTLRDSGACGNGKAGQ